MPVSYYGRDIKDPASTVIGNCQYFFLITKKNIYIYISLNIIENIEYVANKKL